ncbi:MAG: hypothetical protein CMH64_04435 [Nanoarchaeota archaeon]|nr:hypothetical protein [Nanoarchaeota archaeon]|tara:strand:+ start:210 stop:536 length:327 start_codon:yes stop_codon:yes gene_type:complete
MRDNEKKERIWPLTLGCAVLYAANIALASYFLGEGIKAEEDQYTKIGFENVGQPMIKVTYKDIDHDGIPDTKSVETTFLGPYTSSNTVEAKCCTDEEIKWFQEKNSKH